MAELFWTPRATRCLKDIAAYLGEYSAEAANQTLHGILQKAEMLRRFPEMGPAMPHGNRQGLRQLVYGHCRIIYELADDQIRILAVFHGARDLRDLF